MRMPSARDLVCLFTPQELYAIIYWKMCREPVHPRDKSNESNDVKECYRLLGLTSRSFVAVVQELNPELLMPVVVFYLVLRGLDTVEDDMTINLGQKEPLLRNFYTHIGHEDWTFHGSGPDEKDREVLVKFDTVSKEYNKLKDQYKVILRDAAQKMGNGMADYAQMAEGGANGVSVKTTRDYELYCHYVAGLVGEGLTRLFIEADFVDPALVAQQSRMTESMGQLLQQVNITRDIREDYDDKRYFWPEEVWSKYVSQFGDLFLPEFGEKALQCSSEMVLMALNRATSCLSYMARIKDQSTFNFVAIPQAMAIATLELCFRNTALFERNIKISRGSACQIMMASTQGFQQVCEVFIQYANKIRRKNKNSDPNFEQIDMACAAINCWVENHFSEQAISVEKAEASRGLVLLVFVTFGVIAALTMAGCCP